MEPQCHSFQHTIQSINTLDSNSCGRGALLNDLNIQRRCGTVCQPGEHCWKCISTTLIFTATANIEAVFRILFQNHLYLILSVIGSWSFIFISQRNCQSGFICCCQVKLINSGLFWHISKFDPLVFTSDCQVFVFFIQLDFKRLTAFIWVSAYSQIRLLTTCIFNQAFFACCHILVADSIIASLCKSIEISITILRNTCNVIITSFSRTEADYFWGLTAHMEGFAFFHGPKLIAIGGFHLYGHLCNRFLGFSQICLYHIFSACQANASASYSQSIPCLFNLQTERLAIYAYSSHSHSSDCSIIISKIQIKVTSMNLI